MHNLWQKQENRKKKLICSKCGKLKEAEDDCNWRTVSGTPVCFKDGEDPKDSIDKAFADKGGDKIKFIDIKNDNKHPEGDKIVTALKNNTPDNIKNNPKGAVFLSPDGEWLGSKTGSHNDTLIDSMKKSNISIGDNNDNLVPSAIKATGMMRVNAGEELSLDIAQPLTSSQRNTLQDYILTKNRTPDQIYIQVRGNMANMNTDIIKNSLFR